MTIPPLVSYVWQQLNHLRGRGTRLARWATDNGRAILPGAVRLPILRPAFVPTWGKPATQSPTWWRLLHLIWLRQRRWQKNKQLQGRHVTGEEQLIDSPGANRWAEEPYPNELLPALHAIEEEQLLNAVDELSPMVIKNLLLPPVAMVELPRINYDFFQQTYTTSVPHRTRQITDELEAEDTGGSAVPDVSHGKIIYEADQIQKPGRLYVRNTEDSLPQANRQPEFPYPSRWSNRVWPRLAQRLVLLHTPVKERSGITRQGIAGAYAAPVQHRLYQVASGLMAEPSTESAQQDALPYIANIPDIANISEVVTPDKETIHTLENYDLPVILEKGDNLFDSLARQGEPAILRAVRKRPSLFAVPRTARTLNELVFKSLPPSPLVSSKGLGLLPARVASQYRAEISQAKWSVPLLNPVAEMTRQKAETMSVSGDSGSMIPSPITDIVATPDNVSLGQGLQTSEAETPIIHREAPSVTGLGRQLSSVAESIYQMTASPPKQYFKPVAGTPPSDGSEGRSLPWSQHYEASSSRYVDAHQPVFEPMPTPIGEPGIYSKAAASGGSLLATFAGAAHYGSQPVLELAQAPAARQAEAVPPPPRAEARAELTTEQAAAPDIDAMARDVYSKIKRRLERERERALLGLT
jgi:hypothetical protein